MNKFLIVGLGNIGDKYLNTRHNVGFKVLDKLADFFEVSFKLDRLAFYSQAFHKGKKIIMIKPTTYMNLSGKAVKYWMDKEKIPLESVLVIMDDICLDFGVFRLRKNGSDGGHNGLKDINTILNTQNYARFRFGVGKDFPRGGQVDYVLGEWTEKQLRELENNMLDRARDLIISFILEGINTAMNKHNG